MGLKTYSYERTSAIELYQFVGLPSQDGWYGTGLYPHLPLLPSLTVVSFFMSLVVEDLFWLVLVFFIDVVLQVADFSMFVRQGLSTLPSLM